MASQADQETRERLAAIGEIAAEVAHELRNTLQVITASAYLARQDPAASAPHIAKIERNARIAHGIVDDLMSLARGEATQAEPVLFAEIVVAARAEIEPGTAVWRDAITPTDVRIKAHAGLVTRLLHALYENAIRASEPRPPQVRTSARLSGSGSGTKFVVDVEDDGPGVPADIAPHIFKALVTGLRGGTGLGLALAKRIAEAHGGTIALLPRPDGTAGAAFRFEIPV